LLLKQVSDEPMPFGAVAPVHVLGNLKLIDQGEVDHKILAISKTSKLYSQVQSLDDLKRVRPEMLPGTFLYFCVSVFPTLIDYFCSIRVMISFLLAQ
jgi:inorganic pyrophosphatase